MQNSTDKNNYRPITLIIACSKLYFHNNDHQFGFTKQHSTDMCILALKGIIKFSIYTNRALQYILFIRCNMVFGRVNHCKL